MRLAYCFTNEKDSRFLIQGPLSLAYRIFYLQLYYFCHEFFLHDFQWFVYQVWLFLDLKSQLELGVGFESPFHFHRNRRTFS